MKKVKRTLSLRMQIALIVLLCWLLPVLMVLCFMGRYLSDSVGAPAEQELGAQFQVHLRMCADRVNSAAEASRLASYDPTIRDAWNSYGQNENASALYRSCRAFLTRQYQPDSRFRYCVLWFPGLDMTLTTVNTGVVYQQAERWWAEDLPQVQALAEGLDTAVGFLESDGRMYLVRNLVNPAYETYAVLSLALNQPYYFEDLAALTWASDVCVQLGDADDLVVKGAPVAQAGRGVIGGMVKGSGYRLSATAALDYDILLSQVRPYVYILVAMALLLVPLLLFTFRFLRQRVSRPVEVLMEGSSHINRGELGYQLDYRANNREFQYLTESFNHMSAQLHHQFDRLYHEELALRDAQIKTLQSHINPHFLNNTLEIINWEARMNGDAKVSRMIESLSTVLDAALRTMTDVLRRLPEGALEEPAVEAPAGSFVARQAQAYIAEHYAERLTLQDVADHCFVSQWHLSKLLHKHLGQTFYDILNAVRIWRAKELLEDPALRISEIAERVGYADTAHFSRVFKKQEGVSAGDWRNRHCGSGRRA